MQQFSYNFVYSVCYINTKVRMLVLESHQKYILFGSRFISSVTAVLSPELLLFVIPTFKYSTLLGGSLDFPRTKLHVSDLFSICLISATALYAHCDASENTCSSSCPLFVAVTPYHLGISIVGSQGIFYSLFLGCEAN